MFEQVITPGGGKGQLGKGLLASIGLHGGLLAAVLLITPAKPATHQDPILVFVPPRALASASATTSAQPAVKATPRRHRRHAPKVGKRILPTEQAVEETEVELSDELPDAAGPSSGATGVIGQIGSPGPGNGPASIGQIVDFDSSGTMSPPRLIEGNAPGYTADALRAGVEGSVVARCVITATGTVENCRILRGLPFLDRTVLSTLEGQRYAPVTFQGHPVTVNYVFTFRFVLPR